MVMRIGVVMRVGTLMDIDGAEIMFGTLEMLEKKEKVLLKKAGAEVDRAKEYTRAKDKKSAIRCLKRKKLYEQQIEQLGNFQLRIHDQVTFSDVFKLKFVLKTAHVQKLKPSVVLNLISDEFLLEGAKSYHVLFRRCLLRYWCSSNDLRPCISNIGLHVRNIDDVDKTMDEINEQSENMKQIQDAMAAPMGLAADFDEDELEAELEELEGAELEEQLLRPTTTAPTAPVPVPAPQQQTRPAPQQNTAEDEELAALQAEMAL
ncbi:vacuolar protein sorting-associated protein 32 homolog 2 [Tanacetum coccineum]|uniref:Vacuolar protein sorting-associated protein 32 homolog 2 n=1 Tax=Tanacetum coccineum TaxID=301880 RepID=A0ABQ5FQZ3_9ASTR